MRDDHTFYHASSSLHCDHSHKESENSSFLKEDKFDVQHIVILSLYD